MKRAAVKQLPKEQQLSTYSNSQLVIANAIASQQKEQHSQLNKNKAKQLQLNGVKKGKEVVDDKLASIFMQIRQSAQYNNGPNNKFDQFPQYDNRNIHDNANLWKMMRKMAGAGALLPPSHSDNNRLECSVIDDKSTLNDIFAPNYAQTISRAQAGNILPAMSVANSEAVKLIAKPQIG